MGRIRRIEDVKKYLYAGAQGILLDSADPVQTALAKEVSGRFGIDRTGICISGDPSALPDGVLGNAGLILTSEDCEAFAGKRVFIRAMSGQASQALSSESVCGAVLDMPDGFSDLKADLAAGGIDVELYEAAFGWDDIKKGPDGLLPVIIQDHKTRDVLMMAYMNEEAFNETIRTGRMNYYSRSRGVQWLKGETSGHYQYVKSLTLDCDKDTLLAKVTQVGAACHTGSRSCFFNEVQKRPCDDTDPLAVFEQVYAVIRDRKENPKEGSYTNYLFDKGIDKILKKVGEESTELVIAAKNPDPQETVYEFSDLLYHAMVLMVEKGVTWDDITRELANRE